MLFFTVLTSSTTSLQFLIDPASTFQAYKEGLYGRRYVWFLIGWYGDNWFIPKPKEEENLNCTEAEMRKAAQYHFTTEAIMLNPDKTARSISKMVRLKT